MAVKFFFEGILPSSDNPKILRQGIDSTSGTTDSSKVVVTDADGLIDPSFLTERVQDIVGDNLVTDTTSITWTYDDGAGTLEADVNDEYVEDVVGAMLTDSSEIDFTYSDATPSITASIVAGSIDETKLDTSVNASLDLADSALQITDAPGSNSQVIYNNSGSFSASSDFVWDYSNDILKLTKTSSGGLIWLSGDGVQIFSGGDDVNHTYNGSTYAVTTSAGSGFTFNGATVWRSDNDGASSGLDADLLDGQHGSYYLARANHTGTQALATISDAGTAAGENTGTSGNVVPLLDGNNTHSGTNTFNGAVVINELGGDVDTRIEGDTDPNLFFVDAGNDRIGVGTSTPSKLLEIYSTADTIFRVTNNGTTPTSWDITNNEATGRLTWTDDTSGTRVPFKFGINADNNLLHIGVADTSTVDVGGKLTVSATVKTGTYTVAALPTGVAGMRAFVTDANSTTFASEVAGGGANGVPVYYDGSTWRIG